MTASEGRYEDMALYRRRLQSGGGHVRQNAGIASYLAKIRAIIIAVKRTISLVTAFAYQTLRLKTACPSRRRAAIRVAEITKSP